MIDEIVVLSFCFVLLHGLGRVKRVMSSVVEIATVGPAGRYRWLLLRKGSSIRTRNLRTPDASGTLAVPVPPPSRWQRVA